jgi:hypothetical protein
MSTGFESHFDPELLKLASPIERVPYASRRQVGEYVKASRPVIFTGATKEWPATSKWNPEYFVTGGATGQCPHTKQNGKARRRTTH